MLVMLSLICEGYAANPLSFEWQEFKFLDYEI